LILLVLTFRNTPNPASASGIAVRGALALDTCLMAVLFVAVWRWKWWQAIPIAGVFFLVDGSIFAANLPKVPDGGWFPLLVGGIAFTFLTTWARGRKLMRDRMSEVALPIEIFAKSARGSATRVPGTAIFMASTTGGVPSALLHNIKHNKVLHERVVILTVSIADEPYVDPDQRTEVKEVGDGLYRMIMRYGFMEETDIPATLKKIDKCGGMFDMMQTSFFLSRQTLLPSKTPGMAVWREKVFAWMLRNAATAMEFFRLPTNRVVELGSQLEI
jgi:KUP system potassium uptake protein